MLIADTSAWIEWLRQRESAADRALDAAFAHDLLILAEPVKAELLIGARDRAEVGTLRRLLETVDLELVCPRDDFESATELFHTARQRGVTVRGVMDCLLEAPAAWRQSGIAEIEVRDITGNVRDLPTADIAKRGEDKKSMMPEGLVNNCSTEELAAMLAYFEGLVK